MVLLQTGMFISGVLGFMLDNTIPGNLQYFWFLALRSLCKNESLYILYILHIDSSVIKAFSNSYV